MSQPIFYCRGTQALLRQKLTTLLPDLNADLAASIPGGTAPVFDFEIGMPENPSGPQLATSLRYNLGPRVADAEKIVRVTYDIYCVIPGAGNNTEMAIEMARQLAADHVLTLLDDDTQMLTPKIDAGWFGAVQSMEGERGVLVDLDEAFAADKITRLWGWQVPFTLSFSLQTR